MNNINKIELYKSRSYLSCITEAFNMFAHNLRTIFFHTWTSALALAVLQSFCIFVLTSIFVKTITTGSVTLFAISLVLSILAQVFMYGQAVGLVNCQKKLSNIKKVFRLMLTYMAFLILIAMVLTSIADVAGLMKDAAKVPQAISSTTIVVCSISVIIGLLMLPYVYVFTKYVMEPKAKLRALLYKSYKTGLRHWGFIFTTTFLTYLCMVVCVVILALPAVIIISARITSINGVMLLGDPAGLPSYFDLMQFGFFVLANFVWSYICVIFLFVCFFVYGSIETREKEKKKFLNDLNDTEDQDTKTSK